MKTEADAGSGSMSRLVEHTVQRGTVPWDSEDEVIEPDFRPVRAARITERYLLHSGMSWADTFPRPRR